MASTSGSAELAAAERERLERNLAALDRVDPELAERLRLPVDGSRTRLDEHGALFLRLHRSWVKLDVAGEWIDEELRALAGAAPVLVLGVGRGEILERLLAEGVRTVAWERDPWLVRLFLARAEVSAAIASRMLGFALGIDLFAREDLAAARVVHPVLGQVYASEIRLAEHRPRSKRAILCAGGLFVDELRTALERRGYALWTLALEELAKEELDLTMSRFRPEVVFAVNYTEGVVEFAAEHRVKLVVWEVDPATAPPRKLRRPAEHAFVFTYREANVEPFVRAGLAHVEHLPLAADPELRRPLALDPTEIERLGAPLAFVGSSLVENARACRARFLSAWRSWRGNDSQGDGERVLVEVLAAQRKDFSRYAVPELLDERARGFRAAMLDRGGEDPALLAAEISASEKRLSVAANLGALGLSVWGDEGWRAVERYGVRWRGPAGHHVELTRIFNACPLHVDIGRIYQGDIVTMRVFDALACGRLVIAEHSADLERLFRIGREVESYRTIDELRSKVRTSQERPRAAARIARAGQEAVLTRHTIAQRVETMLSRSMS